MGSGKSRSWLVRSLEATRVYDWGKGSLGEKHVDEAVGGNTKGVLVVSKEHPLQKEHYISTTEPVDVSSSLPSDTQIRVRRAYELSSIGVEMGY